MKILVLFFCSGATALIYEVLWSKYLGRLLGSTVQAQTIVLAVFMGGLALGNRLFGKRADLLRRPLTGYGWIEVAIGMYAFFFPHFYRFSDQLFILVGSRFLEQSGVLLLIKTFLSAALLLFPTILMGGTLPLLASWLQGKPGQDKRLSTHAIGIFYAVNSLGAVCGAGVAGFYLVQALGMVASLQVTAFFNVIIGVIAIGFGKRDEPFPPVATAAEAADQTKARVGLLGLLVALTGGISMGMEVLAARSLALIVGGSLQAFAIVLMAFILGIGIGSLVISRTRYAHDNPAPVVHWLLLLAGTLIALYVITIERWTVFYSQARFGLANNETGYVMHQLLVAFLALLVLGLPASFLGAVLPLCMRLVSGERGWVANKVGRLLTANTLGAVAGVLFTGFILMPWLGLRGALGTVSIVTILLAILLAHRQHLPVLRNFAVVVAISLSAGMLLTGEGWRQVVGSGIFRMRGAALTTEAMNARKRVVDVLFYKDGPDATVSVERSGNTNESQLILRINGKADASTRGDMGTQYLLAHLPLTAVPAAKEVFVLGFGSGVTAGAVLGHPIQRLTLAENCQPVLDAAPIFSPWNRGVITNSKLRLLKEDARTVLKLSDAKYDVIISEPSNPWVAGIGSVFSREFYEIAASRLTENGVMAQWFHIYEMHDGIVFLVLRTFAEVFPYIEIWDTQTGDIVLLGAKQPWQSGPAAYQKIFEREEPRKDLESIGIKTPLHLFSRQIASQKTASAIPGPGPIQTDDFPVLEYAAPEAFFIGRHAENLFRFDERTHQFIISPPEKLQVLKALPHNALFETYAHYPSVNETLAIWIKMRATLGARKLQNDEAIFPVVFRPAEEYDVEVTATGPEENFLRAEVLFLAHPEEWSKGVELIGRELVKYVENPELRRGLRFRPGYYAAVAARNLLGRGHFEEAFRFISMGLTFDREDQELLYLHRLLQAWAPPPEIAPSGNAAQISE